MATERRIRGAGPRTWVRVQEDEVAAAAAGGDGVVVIGPITLKFHYQGRLVGWSRSSEKELLGDVEVPAWVAHHRYGLNGQPDMYVKVAVRDGSPEVVELSFSSPPGREEIRQKHLRALIGELDRLAVDLYALEIAEAGPDDTLDEYERAMRVATKFIERQRLPRDYRVIDHAFLREVAQVYRENIDRAPTKAVAKRFGVKDRMASTYVDRARRAGFLPPTKQGKKKA